ncbi:hypothetical protein MOV74_36565, partial [Bradyrhizobium sp. SHOUNA76]|nr:hypothetical protein [Bradyrhizobium sp. SHOUNA76]
MADDKPEDAGLAPDAGRAKRTPPTIDLEATEVSTQPQEAAVEPGAAPAPEHAEAEQAQSDQVDAEPERIEAQAPASSISPWVIAPFSGVVAAAVVIAVGWMLGWPAVQA